MGDVNELFWNAAVDEIKRGYKYNESSQEYICLICGRAYAKGVIYPHGNILFEAEKAVSVHINEEHSSMFEYLLDMDKKITGLTDLQKNLLSYFYKGYSDSQIVEEIDGGSTSTIRNHRFSLKQREKQAKIFLCIMQLLEESKSSKKSGFMDIHKSATMIDDRYAITEEENEKYLKKYFPEGLEGPLSEFPLKQKRKLIILKHLIKRFETGREYTEKEVNELLKKSYHDYVTLRRYLIEYGFMDRKNDGSAYWVKV